MEGVASTAFVIAEFRIEENTAANPLYRDEIAPRFLDARTRAMAAQAARAFPPAADMVRARTAYFDHAWRSAHEEGFRQFVILGAGLDTRPHRLPVAQAVCYEVDAPATLQLKARALHAAGIASAVRCVPGDYVREGVLCLLTPHGFDPGVPTFVLWEGNTSYLTREEVFAVLAECRTGVPRVRIALDFMAERVIQRTTGYDDLDGYIEQFARNGAPWKSGFDDVAEIAGPAGLQVVDAASCAELLARYRPEKQDGSPLFRFYHVATLEAP